MRTLLGMVLLLGGVTAVTVSAQAGDANTETKAAVAAVKRAIVAGHQARDRAALDALYADDYLAIDARGVTRTKRDLLDALPTDPPMLEGRYDIVAVRQWGNTAVATGHGRLVYRNPDGSTRVSEYDSFNVFERRDGRWLYVSAFLP